MIIFMAFILLVGAIAGAWDVPYWICALIGICLGIGCRFLSVGLAEKRGDDHNAQ